RLGRRDQVERVRAGQQTRKIKSIVRRLRYGLRSLQIRLVCNAQPKPFGKAPGPGGRSKSQASRQQSRPAGTKNQVAQVGTQIDSLARENIVAPGYCQDIRPGGQAWQREVPLRIDRGKARFRA